MKKLKYILYLLLISIALTIPVFAVNADSKKEVFYPAGINDYVDLDNISHFAVYENKVFYAKNNTVYCYNKLDKSSTILNSTGTILNLVVEGDYLFIFANGNYPYVYNIETLQSKTFQSFTKTYNKAISVNYVNDKYYFAYVDNNYPNSINVWSYTSNLILDKKFDYGQSFSNTQAHIALSDDLIAYKPYSGDKIYLFKYPTTDLEPVKSGSDNPYFKIDGFDNTTSTKSIALMNISDNAYSNCIFINYEGGTSTKVCKFNGQGLTYNSDNSLVCDKIITDNNQLYVYNASVDDITTYSYNITNDSFSRNNLILAGEGDEQGRFSNVTNVTYKGGVMYVTDSGNNRIQIISNDQTFVKSNLNGTISEVVVDSKTNYYYVIYDGSYSRLYKNGTYLYNFSSKKIISIDMSIDDTIYAITTDGYLLHYINNSTTVSSVKLGKTIDSNSKLRINNNYLNFKSPISSIVAESRFNVSVNNLIYRFNSSGSHEKTLTLTSDTDILDFKFNGAVSSTPVYALLSNGTLVKSSFNEAENKNVILNGFSDYSAFSMDIKTGKFQLFNTNLSAFEIYSNDEFSTPCALLNYDNNTHSNSGFTEVWQYSKVKSNAFIYDYYYYVGDYYHTGQITNVIVINANEEFAYVGYTLNNKLTFGYVRIDDLIDGIKPMAIGDTTYKLRTTNKNVSVFRYPSIHNDIFFYSFAQGDIITTYGKYVSSIDNNDYYIVKVGSQYGYVCANDVVLNENLSKNIKTNAKIKIFDGSKKVDVYLEDKDGSSVLCQLPDGYKINIEDYDKNSKYTRVSFIDEDQQEREGYILTTYVKPNGLSTAVITAIIMLIVDVIIAIVVITIYHHYKKKQKEQIKK